MFLTPDCVLLGDGEGLVSCGPQEGTGLQKAKLEAPGPHYTRCWEAPRNCHRHFWEWRSGCQSRESFCLGFFFSPYDMKIQKNPRKFGNHQVWKIKGRASDFSGMKLTGANWRNPGGRPPNLDTRHRAQVS